MKKVKPMMVVGSVPIGYLSPLVVILPTGFRVDLLFNPIILPPSIFPDTYVQRTSPSLGSQTQSPSTSLSLLFSLYPMMAVAGQKILASVFLLPVLNTLIIWVARIH
jgi:hypothetical protein